jgi:hypothetical protein
MTEPSDPQETVSLKDLLFSNMFEIQALAELLISKGILSEQE